MSLLPGLEVAAGSTHPAEASSGEGSLEEVAPSMPQDSGPGAHQALNSTDLDVLTEAVTCKSQGTGAWGGNLQGLPRKCKPGVSSGVQVQQLSTPSEARLQAIPFASKRENRCAGQDKTLEHDTAYPSGQDPGAKEREKPQMLWGE